MTAGTSYSIFQRVYDDLPHLESKWFASMRSFMARVNASFELDHNGVPPLEREHDSHIMDVILESNRFTAAQTRRINYCRLFLQAVTFSDITDATGMQLDASKLNGTPSAMSSTTTWLQVHQDRPSETEWKLWRRANKLWSSQDGVLCRPLGSWLHPRSQQRQQHFAYHKNRRLYIRAGANTYQVCKQTRNHGEYRITTRERRFETLGDVSPVAVIESRHNPDYWCVHPKHNSIIVVQEAPTRAETFDAFVQTLEPWEIDVLRLTVLRVDPKALCAALSHGFRAASDGSVRVTTQGAFGWVLSTDQGFQAATGMGPARGPRAKGYGLLSILRFLIRVAEFTGRVEAWRGVLVTDSQSVLKTLGGGDRPFDATDEPVSIDGMDVVLGVLCPDWDILIEIQHALKQLPELQLKFIKGHQDEKIPYAQLPLLARLNVDANAMAGSYQDCQGQDRPVALITPRTRVQLHLLEGTVTSSHAATLRHAYCGPPLLEAVRIKNSWSEATVTSINW